MDFGCVPPPFFFFFKLVFCLILQLLPLTLIVLVDIFAFLCPLLSSKPLSPTPPWGPGVEVGAVWRSPRPKIPSALLPGSQRGAGEEGGTPTQSTEEEWGS